MKADRDIIIIGAGAAGLAAAQYAARANLSTLVLEEMASGGQALIIDQLENYPGFPEPISGMELSRRFETQAVNFGAAFEFATVNSLAKDGDRFVLSTSVGERTCLACIVATGAKHKTLGIPGEEEFMGRGVSYCGTCDGPLFKNKRMLVVGGGDAACDESTYLANLAEKVIHVHRKDRFRAQRALADRVLKNAKIEVRFHTQATAIAGERTVKKVTLHDSHDHRTYEETVDAVFVFIGSVPSTQFLKDLPLDEGGYIITDGHMETSLPGLFAVGDVRTTPFRQLVVAAGEGAIAAHQASQYIDVLKGQAYG